jgi:uncharacterized RDD family membrane protein YckC
MEERAMGDVAITPRFAGFWRRFAGLIIDGIILGIIGGVLYAIINALNLGIYTFLVIDVVIAFLYFLWGWGRGQTVGCMALNIRIINQEDGSPPGYGKAVVRYIVVLLCQIIGILFIIGALWMLWDSKKQTWWDKAATTFVVNNP